MRVGSESLPPVFPRIRWRSSRLWQTAGDPLRTLFVFIAIVLPSFLAHQINYLIGSGLGPEQTEHLLRSARTAPSSSKQRWSSFALTLWHPHFAALTCLAAGALGMRYGRFLSYFAPMFLAWNCIWGVMYNLGFAIAGEGRLAPLFLIYLLSWLASVTTVHTRDWKRRSDTT